MNRTSIHIVASTLVVIATLILPKPVLSGPAVFRDPTPQILADMARTGYSETFEDLDVKVLGGHVTFTRTLVANSWVFNRHWQPALATASCGGNKVARGTYEYFYSGTETVTYLGSDHEADIYEYSKDKRFIGIQDPNEPPPVTIKLASGGTGGGGSGSAIGACSTRPVSYLSLRWEDSFGNWIDYDGSNGRALRYGDRNGITVSFSYDANGNRDGVFDHFGNQVLYYQYQTFGNVERLASVSDVENRQVQYVWSGNGSTLDKVIDVRGFEWVMTYGEGNRLEKITDPEGRQKFIVIGRTGGVEAVLMAEAGETIDDGVGTSFSYLYDRAESEFTTIRRQTGGREESLTFDENGYIIRHDLNGFTLYTVEILNGGRKKIRTSHNGNQTINEYDERDNLIKQTFADGAFTTTAYNEFSLPLRFVDEVGTVTLHEYDENGNLLRRTDGVSSPAERATEFEYDQYGQNTLIRSVGDANTATAETIFTYDTNGNLQTITDPEDNIETYTHDIMGNVLTRLDRRGKLWTFTYDAAGNRLTEEDPLTFESRFEYDKTGYLVLSVDPMLYETSFEYDSRGNRTQTTDHLGGVSKTRFNNNDFPHEFFDESNKEALVAYDLTGRTLRSTDGAGNATDFEYDNKAISENGGYFQQNKLSYPTIDRFLQYDRRERLSQDTMLLNGTDSLVFSTWYDPAGRVIRETDANGENIYTTRDALGRVRSIVEGIGSELLLTLDDRDNVISFTNQRGKAANFSFDKNNRLTGLTLPLGQVFTYEYDENGHVVRSVDPLDQVATYTYDDVGRVERIRHFANSLDTNPVADVAFEHDSRGLMTSWTDGVHSGTFTYDELGRITGETTNYGGVTLSVSYSYNANGTLDTFTDADNTNYRFLYDEDNKPEALIIPGLGTVAVNEFEWRAPKKITVPGGVSREYLYSGLLEPTEITVRDPASNIVSRLAMTYDGVRNVKTRNDGGSDVTYNYDANHRLVSAVDPNQGDSSYILDDAGNRTGQNGSIDTWLYDDNDRLISTDTATFDYDDNGNLVSRSASGVVTNFFYDVADRLVRVETESGQVIVQYGYDPFDRRLWKETGGTRTYYLYSDAGLIGEYSNIGSQISAFGYMPGSGWTTDPVYMKANGEYFFYHNDELGTPRLLTSLNGSVAWSALYGPFGNASVSATVVQNPLRFAGQYFDEETGLHYNWRRYYDPTVGRYITADPTGYSGGANLYTYADVNPINRIDPTGECAVAGGAGYVLDVGIQIVTKGCIDWAQARTSAAIDAATCGLGRAYHLYKLWKMRRPCRNSFSSDTLVHAESGLVPISEIKKGDKVLSFSEWTGEKSYQPVAAVISYGMANMISDIELDSGANIVATSGHPMYVLEKGWVEASFLQIGDRIAVSDGAVSRIVGVEKRYSEERVYNLSVANTHTYYVGEIGYLAHNCPIELVGGRRPINSDYAGRTHPSGVKFKESGFPDFTPYAVAEYKIPGLTGRYATDAGMANARAGLASTPDGMVWHHVEDGVTMQLIPQEIHDAARHTGGSAVIRHGGG